MKISRRVRLYVAGGLVVFGCGAGTVMALQPDEKPAKQLTVQQVSDNKGAESTEPVEATTPTATEEVHKTAPTAAQPHVTPQAAPRPAPAPNPVTVTAYQEIDLGGGNKDCKFTYSDGTTYAWHWITVNPQGSWSTDSSGNNGRWDATTTTSGSCDSSVIGKAKS